MATSSLDPNKTGLALGALLGAGHLLWAVLVALGGAQAVIDFLFWIHFIKPVYVIAPFSVSLAALLVAVTAAVGYLMGFLFGWIWRWVHLR